MKLKLESKSNGPIWDMNPGLTDESPVADFYPRDLDDVSSENISENGV